jgi:hypothetical protein
MISLYPFAASVAAEAFCSAPPCRTINGFRRRVRSLSFGTHRVRESNRTITVNAAMPQSAATPQPATAPWRHRPSGYEIFVGAAGLSPAWRSESSSNHIAFRIANAHASPSPNIHVKYHTGVPQ